MRNIQKKMLWYGMPIMLVLLGISYWLADIEPKTFHVAPWMYGGAVRTVLLDVGMREVAHPDQALVVWTDVELARTSKTVRKQRMSTLSGVVSGRADASCRVLAAAHRRVR